LRAIVRRSVYWSVIAGIWGVIAIVGLVVYHASKLPPIDQLAVPKRPPNIAIMAADGSLLANRGETGGRTVTLGELPSYLPNAFIAIEDHRFRQHFGIDPLGIGRALVRNVTQTGGVVQGGSTLTRQLAKNLFLTQERTASRKIQEAILALDPDFRGVYVWISSAGIYSSEGVTESDMERTLAIVRRGRERFPQDGELAWVLGATLTFEAPPYTPEERREAVRLEGLEHLMVAARLGAAPEWLVLSNTSMLANLGRAERAIEHLEEMYALVHDESVRASIEERIEQVRSDAYGAAFVEANERLERERLRTFPYVSPDLYVLLAPASGDEAEEGSAVDDAPEAALPAR
jgi:tetratricopeptide (TPR) repeat protein